MSDGRDGGKALEVRWLAAGQALDEVGLAMAGYRSLSVDIVGVSIRAPRVRGDDYLLTIRGLDEDGARVVAFHGAADLVEAFRGLQNRLLNGSLKWRIDNYQGGGG